MPTLEQARQWYSESDPVHGFDHIQRVYRMAERLASEEGADIEIVCAAALLHDARGGDTQGGEQGRQEHNQHSALFARRLLAEEGWPEDRIQAVEHCILAHRFRGGGVSPETLEAQILFDADKLDVLGAVGVARTIAFDVVVAQPIFAEPSERFLRSGEKEPGEPHSSYHEYLFKLRKIKDMLHTTTARRLAQGRHEFLAHYFDQLACEVRGER